MQADNQSSTIIYLDAFIRFYSPKLAQQWTTVRKLIHGTKDYAGLIASIPQATRSQFLEALEPKKAQLQKILKKKFYPIGSQFTKSLELLFSEVPDKYKQEDITYYKLKVVLKEYKEEEEALKKKKLTVKEVKSIQKIVEDRLQKILIDPSIYLPIREIWTNQLASLQDHSQSDTIQAKWEHIFLSMIQGDNDRLQEITLSLQEELFFQSYQLFEKILHQCQNQIANLKKSKSVRQSRNESIYIVNSLIISEQATNIYRDEFVNKLKKKFEDCPLQQRQSLFDDVFANSKDFEHFGHELYKTVNPEPIINKVYRGRGEQQKKAVLQLVKGPVDQQVQKRQQWLQQLLIYDYNIKWGLLCDNPARQLQYLKGSSQQAPSEDNFVAQYFRTVLQTNQSLFDIVKCLLIYLYNCIKRKQDIRTLLTKIQKIKLSDIKYQTFRQTLLLFELSDFIHILIKNHPNKEEIGLELYNYKLHRIDSFPLPLLTTYFDRTLNKYKYQNNLSLLNLIDEMDQLLLVLNFGTKTMVQRGKTTFLRQLLDIDTDVNSSRVSFDQQSIKMYTVGSSHKNKRKIIIIDFNGDCLSNSHTYKAILNLFLKHASIVFFHMHHDQAKDSSLRNYFTIFNSTRSKIKVLIRNSLFNRCEGRQFFQKSYQCHLLTDLRQSSEKIEEKQISRLLHAEQLKIFRFKELRTDMQPSVCNSINAILAQISSMMKDERDYFKTVYPNFKIKEQNANLILNKLQNIQYDLQDENSFINNTQVQLSKPVMKFIQFCCQTQLLYKIWMSDSMMNHWIEAQKIKRHLLNKDNGIVNNTLNFSLQTFILELVSFLKTSNKQAFLQEVFVVEQFYQQALKSRFPINIVSTFSLQFGNKFIKEALKHARDQYKKHKVYVISVIGFESHAKSSLLNRLFDTRFAVAMGKKTYGINMVLIQERQMLLAILDYQGLGSSQKKDPNFDLRITSFAFVISDLLIINHKGQLNNSIEDIIDHCAFIAKALNKEAPPNKHKFKPNRIIFALRDMALDDQTNNRRNQQILSTNYSKKFCDRFNKAMDLIESGEKLKVEDTYIFENAFYNQPNYGRKHNEHFSEKIHLLRASILQKIPRFEPKLSSLDDFYAKGEIAWKKLQQLSKEQLERYRYCHEEETQKRLQKQIEGYYQKLKLQFKESSMGQLSKMKQALERVVSDTELKQKRKEWFQKLSKNFMVIKDKIFNNLKDFIINNQEYKYIQKRQLKKYFWELKFLEEEELHKPMKAIEEKIEEIKNQLYHQKIRNRIHTIQQVNHLSKDECLNKLREQLKQQIEELNQQIAQYESTQKFIETELVQQVPSTIIVNNNIVVQSLAIKQPINLKKYIEKRTYKQLLVLKQKEFVFQIRDLSEYRRRFQSFMRIGYGSQQEIRQFKEQFLSVQNTSMYAIQTLRNPEVVISLLTFFKTAFRILEELIDNNIIDIEKSQFDQFFSRISTALGSHYQKQAEDLVYIDPYYRQSVIFDPDVSRKLKIKSKVYFMVYLYAFVPNLCMKKYLHFRKETIKVAIDQKKSLHQQVSTELQVVGSIIDNQCIYWIKKALNRFFMIEKKQLSEKITSLILQEKINSQIILVHILLEVLLKGNINTTDHLLQCYKAVVNLEEFMVQHFTNNRYQRKILPKIQSELKQAKNRIVMKMNMFKQGIKINSMQTFQGHLLEKVLLSSFYSTLLNGDKLFFEAKWDLIDNRRFFQHFQQFISENQSIITKKTDEVMKELGEEVDRLIYSLFQTKVKSMIVGCQERCPQCGMKCRYKRNHVGRHEVIPGTHLLYCFHPQRIYSANQLTENSNFYTWCCGRQPVQSSQSIIKQLGNDNLGWFLEFKNMGIIKDETCRQNLKKMWANIGEVIAKQTKNVQIKMTGQIAKMKTPATLTTKHLESNHLLNYHKRR